MTKSRFEQAVELVLQHEGGFVQHPRDPGGATKFGITRGNPVPGAGTSRLRGRRAQAHQT
jgi:lysozyme family protein